MPPVDWNDPEFLFWKKLEFRVCGEMRNPNLRRLFLWCDGFIPENYFLDETPMRIIGAAWIGDEGSSGQQHKWQFTLTSGFTASSRTDIDWAALLPSPEATNWLFVAPAKRQLELKLP